MNNEKHGRIFWLGMHKVLTATELPHLRSLGYEVFNPPYLSTVYDQSAQMDWDKDQHTTLPPDVFARLAGYNFFYNNIDPDIAEVLNAYFGAMIVTINPQWLAAIVRVFHGKIIYRTYGQVYQLSAHLVGEKVWREILYNRDFYHVPFAEETLVCEHRWLVDRSFVVPYTLPLDVYDYEDSWERTPHNDEIMVSVPNLSHPYYDTMYKHLNAHFPGSHLRIYGVQRAPVNDRRVVGTVPRADVLRAYQRAAGYFYPYEDNGVCYLPPIEMMTIGGPVVYTAGSLLQRFFKGHDPGVALTLDDQRFALARLRAHDRVFIKEVICSQKQVYKRYHPDYVNPIFDATFKRLLGEGAAEPAFETRDNILALRTRGDPAPREIWVLCHWPGRLIHENPATGAMFAGDGISRVITKVIAGLVARTAFRLILTCYARQASVLLSYFGPHFNSGRLALYVLDREQLSAEQIDQSSDGGILQFLLERQFRPGTTEEQHFGEEALKLNGRLRLARDINGREPAVAVFVPHYYHFPEALQIDKRLIFYLPDYMPHFFPGVPFEGTVERDGGNSRMGRTLSERSAAILVNSEFTKSYLPSSALKVAEEKIRVIPIPLLSSAFPAIPANERRNLDQLLESAPFLFYPTANRPNKDLTSLLYIFHELLESRPNLKLVLTCNLGDYAPVAQAASDLELRSDGGVEDRQLILLPSADESALRYFYENAAALAFTSTMEGNFPPQIIEALHYDTPIVATRLPHIVEVLGDTCEGLRLCGPRNSRDFVVELTHVLRNRPLIQQRQLQAKRTVVAWNHFDRFSRAVADLFLETCEMGRLDGQEGLQPLDDRSLPFGLMARAKRCLAASLSDYQFVHCLYDFMFRRFSDQRQFRDLVGELKSGKSRSELICQILGGAYGWGWPDQEEIQFVLQWLTAPRPAQAPEPARTAMLKMSALG